MIRSNALELPVIDIDRADEAWASEEELQRIIARAVLATAENARLNWPPNAELSLVFTNDAKMAEINGQWRQKPVATNVLSFPGADIAIGQTSGMMIGDLVFAYETIKSEAIEQAKTFDDHLIHLIIHGFLHLFGYDHILDEDAETMEQMERQILASLNVADPYQ